MKEDTVRQEKEKYEEMKILLEGRGKICQAFLVGRGGKLKD